MRCTRHDRNRCTNAACQREATAGAVTGPAIEDYQWGYVSPPYTVTVRDGHLTVQVAKEDY